MVIYIQHSLMVSGQVRLGLLSSSRLIDAYKAPSIIMMLGFRNTGESGFWKVSNVP